MQSLRMLLLIVFSVGKRKKKLTIYFFAALLHRVCGSCLLQWIIVGCLPIHHWGLALMGSRFSQRIRGSGLALYCGLSGRKGLFESKVSSEIKVFEGEKCELLIGFWHLRSFMAMISLLGRTVAKWKVMQKGSLPPKVFLSILTWMMQPGKNWGLLGQEVCCMMSMGDADVRFRPIRD